MTWEPGPGPIFSTGAWVSVEVLRYTAVDADYLAHCVGLPVDDALEQLDRWATGEGLPYGIRVDRDARTWEAVG